MAAATLNFTEFEQGATFTRTLTITVTGGAAKDITNVSFAGQVRPRKDSSDKIADFSFTKTNASNGVVRMDLANADTSKVTDGAVYDIEMTEGTTITRLLEGTFTVSTEVTQ